MGSMSQEEMDALMNSMAGGGDGARDSGGPPETDGGYIPNEAELGILGEIYNISMGAAATAVSTLLSMKVDITAPSVEMVDGSNLIYQPFEPAVGVEIKYVKGIEGVNVFILSQLDVMKIFDIMVGGTGVVDESTEFSDLHMSAIGEVMNQMMGQSSMSLADFLNTQIDISTPTTYRIEGDYNPAKEGMQGTIVATRFKFIVGDIINSEMLTTCSMQFAESMIEMAKKAFGMSDGAGNTQAQKIIEAEVKPEQLPQPQPQPQTQSQPQPPPPAQPQPQQQPQQNVVGQTAVFQDFGAPRGFIGPDAENNARIRSVPVDVTVEIGKTKKFVSEILEFGEGSIIELDRQNAEPVDVFVNGVLFAKGSVVVVEENFAVKITEIL